MTGLNRLSTPDEVPLYDQYIDDINGGISFKSETPMPKCTFRKGTVRNRFAPPKGSEDHNFF